MARISVLIPHRNAGEMVAAQVTKISAALDSAASDYELIVVDDASRPDALRPLEEAMREVQHVRLLRFSPACGLSAALSAGLATARGDVIVALPAGDFCSPTLIRALLDELIRADLVVGRPHRQGLRKALHRIARIPRWLLLGLEVRDPECVVWAARREAIMNLQLPRGMYRYLATLVSARGFRVGEITVPTSGRSVALSDGLPNPGDLLAAWWFKRRWRQYKRMEVIEATRTLPRPPVLRSPLPQLEDRIESSTASLPERRRGTYSKSA
ncbi:MAG: glycosyltransferase family 2 protein [Pirellulaceae bacterium]